MALHLLLILQLARLPPPERVKRPAILSVFTVPILSGPEASAKPMPKRVVPPATPVPVLIVPLQPAIVDPSASSGSATPTSGAYSAAGGCALAQNVGEAIGKAPLAMAEIDSLPPDVRTSADAIMLWNGQWLDPSVTPAGINPGSLRRVVEQVITDAPAECRDAEATGPQFIPVPEGGRTVMIVVGSGIWHWADLVASRPDCLAGPATTCHTQGVADTSAQGIGR